MDDTQPLLAAPNGLPEQQASSSLCTVDFDPHGDPENPLDWPNWYKWGIIFLLAFMAFTTTFTCVGVVPISSQIILDLEGEENNSASVLLVTIWELGEAAGPLIIAPLSEVYGRYPLYNLANLFFILTTAVSALSQSSALLVFARFLTGCVVAANVLNPSIIGDIMPPEQRGSAMSMVLLAPLVGGAVGPAIAGAIAQTLGWRKVLWMAAMIATVCEVAFLTLFRETYKARILQRRARRRRAIRLRNATTNLERVVTQEEDTGKVIWQSIKRPARVFFGSFVLQILSLYGAFEFSMFYVMSTSLPNILNHVYNFPPALCGASFLVFSVGSATGIMLCNLTLDRIYVQLSEANGVARPEYRLPVLIIGAFILPASTILYGWTAQESWPSPLLLTATGTMGFGLLVGYVPLMAYVVDSFGMYSASAMTAVLITRGLASTFLPLAVSPLTAKLGYGFGFLVVAATLLVLVPIPILVMRYGSHWREYSAYTKKVV